VNIISEIKIEFEIGEEVYFIELIKDNTPISYAIINKGVIEDIQIKMAHNQYIITIGDIEYVVKEADISYERKPLIKRVRELGAYIKNGKKTSFGAKVDFNILKNFRLAVIEKYGNLNGMSKEIERALILYLETQ